MFKRKIYEKLLERKASQNHKQLIIRGLRQIGKTTIAEEFGKENYESYIKLDFRKNPSLKEIFGGDYDVDNIIFSLTVKFPNAKFIKRSSIEQIE